MKGKIQWNLNWHFCEGFSADRAAAGDLAGMEAIHLPHQVKTLTYNCFSHNDTQMLSTYAKHFTLSQEDAGKRIVVEFDGVMTYFDLYVNGALVGSHKGGYSRSRFEISSFVHPGNNHLYLMVDSRERDDIPPFGCVIDYLTFGGVYRDVNLYLLETAFLSDVLFRYHMTGTHSARVYPEFYVDNSGSAFTGTICCQVVSRDGTPLTQFQQEVAIPEGRSSVQLDPHDVDNIRRWDPDDPNMYVVRACLKQGDATLDTIDDDIGFRSAECRADGLFVNGRRIVVVGMDRHQSYPYIGYSIGRRAQRADADLLKQYGMNTVRTSHYMQSQYFLDRCDEIGMLVFEEIPGWQHIGDADWKDQAVRNTEEMVLQWRNHPSVFLWGVRINESADDDIFYRSTNEIAHRLDPTRPTGGVRNFAHSHLLEDVYTYNDFSHHGSNRG